jgi:uncharacterized protein DUF222
MDALLDPLGVNPASLSHDERLTLLESIEQHRAALDAQQQLTLALLAAEGDAAARAKEWVREEVAAVLCVAPTTAAAKLHEATQLVHRLPRTFDRLVDGSITMQHARAVIDAGQRLDDPGVVELENRVLAKAEGCAVGTFRQIVRRARIAVDSRSADQQHADSLAERRVRMFADDDGMATIWAYLRADAAAALMTAIDASAHALPDPDRTMDQKRADVLADLGVLAGNGVGITWQGQRPAVQISVALSTLLGTDDQPGELDGYGPVPASLARELASDPSGTWRRLITDGAGHLLDYGRDTYRPPAALRDHVVNLHRTCTFPGCRRPACKGELDHIEAYDSGGSTSNANLHPPCKRHHDAKHLAGWTVTKNHADTITWISPSGRRYETEPAAHPIDTTGDPPPF